MLRTYNLLCGGDLEPIEECVNGGEYYKTEEINQILKKAKQLLQESREIIYISYQEGEDSEDLKLMQDIDKFLRLLNIIN